MEEDKPFSKQIQVDYKTLRKQQLYHLAAAFVIAAALVGAGIILGRINMLFLVLLSPGLILFTFWIVVFPWSLLSMRNMLKSVEFNPEEGIIKLNGETYKVVADNLYLKFDDGIQKFTPFGGINLNVINDDKKVVRAYYAGPVLSKYGSEIRKAIELSVLVFLEALKQYDSVNRVQEEYEDSFGVVRIEFPADSIRNEFYKTGTLILGITLVACIMSSLPDSFYDDEFLLQMVGFLRFLTYPVTILGLLYVGSFYLTYRKLAKKIEIRDGLIKINDTVFEKNGIKRISTLNSTVTPGYDGEAESWIFINYNGLMHRFYLGQAKNGKCLEPRRKLFNAIDKIFGKPEG